MRLTEDRTNISRNNISNFSGTRNGLFTFWNGDEYEGEFSSVKDKLKITKEGRGVYRTGDGETYAGLWQNDFLTAANNIIFRDGSEFIGTLHEMSARGFGRFKFRHNVELEGSFNENGLHGNAYLKDASGHRWRGAREPGDTCIRFLPCHAFWRLASRLRPSDYICEKFYESGEEEDFYDP